MNMKESSPFTPGNPVPVELFVGRAKQIEEIIKYVKQTSSGKQENTFLIGSRGIGKSSLASFLRYYVSSKMNFLGVHVFLGRVSTLEEMMQSIFDKILKEVKEQANLQSIIHFFGKYIKEIGLFGISVAFAPPQDDLKELVKKFPEAINNLLKKIKEKQKKGLFIVLDDINGLTEKAEFANWYKSFVDEVATHYKDFPVFIMLIGLPEKRDALLKLQPSLMRIFRIVEIAKLSDEEVEHFLLNAFEMASLKVEKDAMRIMVQYSGGLPLLMHEIGDAVFWADTDNVITKQDAQEGVMLAAQKVGEKYLDPKVYRALRSERYKSILRKLGETRSTKFVKKEIEDRLDANEKKVFHNFLRKMKELEVIEMDTDSGLGSYRFVNEIYPVYVWMQSENPKR